jgi:hypothetical protein
MSFGNLSEADASSPLSCVVDSRVGKKNKLVNNIERFVSVTMATSVHIRTARCCGFYLVVGHVPWRSRSAAGATARKRRRELREEEQKAMTGNFNFFLIFRIKKKE